MKVAVLFGLYLVIIAKTQAGVPERFQTKEFLQYLNRMKELGRECGLELGPAIAGKLPDVTGLLIYPEDNDSLNLFWGCIFKKRGIIDEKSNIRVDNTALKNYVWEIAKAVGNTSPFYQNAVRDLVKSCNSVKGEDYAQTAIKLQNCIMRY